MYLDYSQFLHAVLALVALARRDLFLTMLKVPRQRCAFGRVFAFLLDDWMQLARKSVSRETNQTASSCTDIFRLLRFFLCRLLNFFRLRGHYDFLLLLCVSVDDVKKGRKKG